MNIKYLHEWDLPASDAIALQQSLVDRLTDDEALTPADVNLIAGVDVSVKNNISQAAIVVTTFPEMEVVEVVRARQPTSYPYIPGLLTFREGPVLVEAFERLQAAPDAFLFDGMGRIHPRGMGIAAHMGLWLDRPTIGVGKTHFVGDYDLPDEEKGSMSPLTFHDQLIGYVVRTRSRVKPVYVSNGHRITLPGAVALTLASTTRFRLPEPIRMAHKAAGDYDHAEGGAP